jgi:lipopolysaccharide transport system permease protein
MNILFTNNPSNFFDLVREWTNRIIRARYRQSVLGGLWAILQPLSTVAIFSIIFVFFVPVNTGDVPYVLFSYAAIVPWTLFQTSFIEMVDSQVNNMNLISKVYFPREVLLIAAMMARMVDFFIASILLLLMMIGYQQPVAWQGLILIPFLILLQVTLSLGLGFFGSALNVFYRDVRHVFVLVLQLWFYASPIIYPITTVPERLQPIYYLNPMASIIVAYRAILFGGPLPVLYLVYSFIISLAIFVAGFWFFKKVEVQFADLI